MYAPTTMNRIYFFQIQNHILDSIKLPPIKVFKNTVTNSCITLKQYINNN